MKKVNRSSFKLNPIAASIGLAMASQMTANVAYAGSGWGNSITTANLPSTPQTYYANSPAGVAPKLSKDPLTGLATTTIDPITNLPVMVDSGKALRKFVDTLPGFGPAKANNLGQYIPIAVPEKNWLNPATGVQTADDYYEIAAVEYAEKMHSDLPKATHLRGYVQVASDTMLKANGTDLYILLTQDGTPNGIPVTDASRVSAINPKGRVYMIDNPHHLGPIIQAAAGTAVRVKFSNYLPVGGNLFLPVDKSITGAGLGPDGKTYYTENRAEIHLVGGQAPWVSAGSPHQWVAPAGETAAYAAGLGKGVSTQNVPDMADPGPGSTTLYFPNTQSARLMFYQDRTSGLTRLNSYAGLEAGYLITDPVEQGLVTSGVIPADQIPLIIEDKTFVPANIAQQDALWDTTHWGQPGDLWFPHVYETNQDPNAFNATNPVGRWDYGPWFWPIFPATYVLPSGGWDSVNNMSNASFTPEAYQDTPVVNGTAYPTLTVDPKAYRLRILNASNDRYVNLGLYKADTTLKAPQIDRNGNPVVDAKGNPLFFTNTEVKMVPAVADVNGNPLAPSYLDPNCLCQYPSLPQLQPAIQFSGPTRAWPVDNRLGGAPDPTSVGPDFIAIGNDGGLLPNPVDIPSQPITYEANRRSITVTNVYGYGLLLGPAERSDAIVDFSAYAGQTLILFNDAPTPFPFNDQRVDYFTGAPDQTSTGGAYGTLPGYGPNTRTIMQIKVNPVPVGTAPAAPFNANTLLTALPAAYAASNQPRPIVPESAYNAAFKTNDADNYAHVATGSVAQPNLDFTSSGTLVVDRVDLVSSGGNATVVGLNNIVGNATPGTGQGYDPLNPPTVVFNNGSCLSPGAVSAQGFATVDKATHQVTAVTLGTPGQLTIPTYPGYTCAPQVTFTSNPGITGINLISGGSKYTTPKIVFTSVDGKGSGAAATAVVSNNYGPLGLDGVISSVKLTSVGSGYTSPPIVTVTDINPNNAPGSGAVLTLNFVASGEGAQAIVHTNATQSILVQTKAEQELFDATGRYNSTGGVELPWTGGTIQTTVPLSYIDSPTEIIGDGETQIWKIVDNGLWSNSEHFAFVDVQLINRVGWDGTVKPPSNAEVGWKDTLRQNPLEDVVIAMRAKRPAVPFGQPASSHLQDPSLKAGAPGSGLGFLPDPAVTSPAGVPLLTTSTNVTADYDNEFVWYSAILGHSEDDFMRPIVFHPTVVVPDAPALSGISAGTATTLTWTDSTPALAALTLANPKNEIGFKVLRSTDGFLTASVIAKLPANATTWTDAATPVGASYQIVAWNAAGDSQSSNVWTNLVAPLAPTNLAWTGSFLTPATTTNDVSVKLTWTPGSANAVSYEIWKDGATTPIVIPANLTSYTDTPVVENTTHTYVVDAKNAIGTSAAPNPSVTVLAPISVPLAPTGLIAASTSPTTTGVTLNWTNKAFNATGYVVSRYAAAPSAVCSPTAFNLPLTTIPLPATATSYTDTTSLNGSSYCYAVNAINLSTPPVVTQSSALNIIAKPFSVTTGISPATNLVGTAALATGTPVALSWTHNAANAAGYQINVSIDNGITFTPLATVSSAGIATGKTMTYSAAATVPAINTYQVIAVNTLVNPTLTSYPATVVVSILAPAPLAVAPTGLTATVAANGGVTLRWNPVTSTTVFDAVYQITINGGAPITVTNNTNYQPTAAQMPVGSNATITVTALNTLYGLLSVPGPASAPVTVLMPPAPSTALVGTATATTGGLPNGAVTMTWTNTSTNLLAGNAAFTIARSTRVNGVNGPYVAIAPAITQTGTSYSFVDSGLAAGTYTYQITAHSTAGASTATSPRVRVP